MTVRRAIAVLAVILILISALASCADEREFSHCELTLTVPRDFKKQSSDSYDLLVGNGKVAAGLTRITFIAGVNQGIEETYTPKHFAAFALYKSGKDSELYMYGDVPYYTYYEGEKGARVFYTATFFRSKYAYFTLLFACPESMEAQWRDKFLEIAKNVYFTDYKE